MEDDIKDVLSKKDFNIILEKTKNMLKDIDFDKLKQNDYDFDRNYPENFSNWYPNILDFGKFSHVDIINNQIFTLKEMEAFERVDNIDNVDWNEINQILKPTLDKMKPLRLYSMKNGCFSDKFNFEISTVTKDTLPRKLWELNYDSHMFETGGHTELVIRELIPFDNREYMTIYNGMPLRTEVRVFYNMDTKNIEYMMDYWDYDYCNQHISNKNDNLIFNIFHNKIEVPSMIEHKLEYNTVCQLICNAIDTLKFSNWFTGIWSIDFMYVREKAKIYLIDMARGFRSAMWDIDKLTPVTKEMLLNERTNK